MDTLSTASYLVTRVAGASIALPVTAVKEILRAAALTELPGAPPILEGLLNLRGTLVPVIDLRARLGLPPRAMLPDDHLVVLSLGQRWIAVRVDEAEDVVERGDHALLAPHSVSTALAASAPMAGLSADESGVLVVYDTDAFLTEAELSTINVTMAAST